MASFAGRARPLLLLLAALVALTVVGVVTARGGSADDARFDKIEARLATVKTQLNQKIAGLQTEGDAEAGELAAAKATLDELRSSLDSITQDVLAAKGADVALQKRLDDLSSKLSALELRIGVLESRYNDHLCKRHTPPQCSQ